eukprot:TRINITY_DN1887_c0_g2_i1.p1 TRINITY_DN1887_c0_g2~~TRINITY_DN1887_c0_g2_i1.p1  ORF type:complete len:460 (-),score=81.89 TRINITY_DN1887_c0_g2_i1:129-1433(-)
MEPAYVKTSLTGVVGKAQTLGERFSHTKPAKLKALLPTSSSIESTDKVVPDSAMYTSWNGWPQAQQDFHPARYHEGFGHNESWPYPYGMAPMYRETGCGSWGAAALVEGSPPPQGPSMIYCGEDGNFAAPPPQLSATLLGSQQLQPLNVSPGLLDPTAARCPTLTSHVSSASSVPACFGCSPAELAPGIHEGDSYGKRNDAMDSVSASLFGEAPNPSQHVPPMRATSPPVRTGTDECLPWLAPQPLCRAKTCPAAPITSKPPTITRTTCKKSGVSRVRWTVDYRKLKVKDRVAVSPSFELGDNIQGIFRMMLYPTAVSDRKGGASFKKAKGKGSIHIKCESSLSDVHDGVLSMMMLVRGPQDGSDSDVDDDWEEWDASQHGEAPRGPIMHNFHGSGICSLPKDNEEWDFGKAADEESQNFEVLLQVNTVDAKAS